MMQQRKLTVYQYEHVDGADWVIAYSPEDATLIWQEHTGECSEDYPDMQWEERDDTDTMLILVETPDGETPKRETMAAWAEKYGQGFLCSTVD